MPTEYIKRKMEQCDTYSTKYAARTAEALEARIRAIIKNNRYYPRGKTDTIVRRTKDNLIERGIIFVEIVDHLINCLECNADPRSSHKGDKSFDSLKSVMIRSVNAVVKAYYRELKKRGKLNQLQDGFSNQNPAVQDIVKLVFMDTEARQILINQLQEGSQEKELMELYLVKGLTFSASANELGITERHALRLKNIAVEQLRQIQDRLEDVILKRC